MVLFSGDSYHGDERRCGVDDDVATNRDEPSLAVIPKLTQDGSVKVLEVDDDGEIEEEDGDEGR